ncbi:alpha/beta fold hydrolase [Novosphingobium sp. FSY-8]|uniref:Alpha/beta fold hydrolase n=2 Tax=Novosphingobium ovatum TaxID=1908523 RepID=A0ABW9XE31_9SPHN|nr:alpha/beta fold hydrolase [Novosphingobium ovatum]
MDVPAGGDGVLAARGRLLFLPGRGDTYEKYVESLSRWQAEGWAITALDWRGQGGSGRLGDDSTTGHITDFAIWVRDLADFYGQWAGQAAGPVALIGHSMGGHLALRAVAEGAVRPDALVLSAPMLGFYAPGVPWVAQYGLARLAEAVLGPTRAAWSGSEKPFSSASSRRHLLTHDADRYADEAWWIAQRPQLRMGGASWHWMAQALLSMRGLMAAGVMERVDLPVLLLSAPRDRLVSHRAIVQAATRLPQGELALARADAAHEFLREVDAIRDPVMTCISSFLDRFTVPAAAMG